MSSLERLKSWFEQHRAEIRDDFFHFLRFQSISTDPAFAKEMKSCAKWVREYAEKKAGMKAELIETEGYPLVYAEDMRAGSDAQTLLIYGHYDVQPVDPIELWESDPFDPTERGGQIYARGALDDKGQIFYALLAARAWKELGRELPVNLKFCIEGEEESASLGLSKALPHLEEKLKADSLLVVDFFQYDKDTPALFLGARGVLGMEVTLTGSQSDLHSGSHGGMAYNPNKALVQLLSKLWDEKGRVQVKGFYDDVIETTEEERSKYAFSYSLEKYKSEFGIDAIGGEAGYSLAENNCFRPTLEINGIGGGYTGAGFKTVIPAQAMAKISCRLVPNQDPQKVGEQIADFFKKNAVPGMKVKVTFHGGERAFRGNPDSLLAKAVAVASEEAAKKKCKHMLSGASIPIVAELLKVLESDVVGMGYGLDSDNIHAPNEHFDMNRFEKGFLTVARILELL